MLAFVCMHVSMCASHVSVTLLGFRVTGTAARPGSRAGAPQGGVLYTFIVVKYAVFHTCTCTRLMYISNMPQAGSAINQ